MSVFSIHPGMILRRGALLGLCALCWLLPAAAPAQILTGYAEETPSPPLAPPVPPPRTGLHYLSPSVAVADWVMQDPGAAPEAVSAPLTEVFVSPVPPAQAAVSAPGEEEPVDLSADSLERREADNTVIASGNVVLRQAGRVLRADSVSYSIDKDEVVARGAVQLTDQNGDVHRFEEVTLTDQMKDGLIKNLRSVLQDGSRFTAEAGQRQDGVKTVMKDASYTPCEPCVDDRDSDPVWQIRASTVEHDAEERSIAYENARFEIYGVPVAWLPYFSHPDGTIKRKSGFLPPKAGYKSQLGVFVTPSYYWDIAPQRDMTFGVMAMTDENPLGLVQWRERWDNASLEFNGGITSSSRKRKLGGEQINVEDEARGHILARALWDINDLWRSGVNVAWASDDQYMRQYDFIDDDVLQSDIYAERFSGRNYASGRLITFQDVRVREEQEDQPEVLPEIYASFLGEPGAVPLVGGRWSFESSFLGLNRPGAQPDLNRVSFDAGWGRRLVSDYGLLTNLNLSNRLDFYSARDRESVLATGNNLDSATEKRFFPQLHAQTSYPMARPFETMQMTVEPIAALTLAPNIDNNENIPNEDSRDVQIDAGNIFDPSRFPGLDRVEDQSRATYGLRTGLYSHDGSHGDIFLGQSYRLRDDDNPFPAGSGLDERKSDIVGQVTAQLRHVASLNYRFQLDSNDLTSQRHEVDSYASWNRLSLSTTYLFAKALGGTDIEDSRNQIRGNLAYDVTKDWRLRVGATQDLGKTGGLRQAQAGIDHYGQCLSWSLTGERNLTEDASGESDTVILFSIGLKNLGEFQSSASAGTSR